MPTDDNQDLQDRWNSTLPNQDAIGADLIRDAVIRGRAVLINTGWSRHWRTDEYFGENPFLTADEIPLPVCHWNVHPIHSFQEWTLR